MEEIKIGSSSYLLGRAMAQPNFHRAYMTSSRRLLTCFNDYRRWNNEGALPVFFLQRHALELLIKDSLRVVYRVMLIGREAGKDFSEPSAGQLKRLSQEHDLSNLCGDLKRSLFLERDGCSALVKQLEELVDKVVSAEKKHTWSRYPDLNQDDNCLVSFMFEHSLDLEWIQNELELVSSLLSGGDDNYQNALMYEYDSIPSYAKAGSIFAAKRIRRNYLCQFNGKRSKEIFRSPFLPT